MASESANTVVESSTLPKRDNEFYFDDAFAIFQVEDTLFRVRVSYFKESSILHDMFSLPPPTGEVQEGQSDGHPIVLKHDKAQDFKFLLAVLREIYDCGRRPPGSKENWVAVLRLAHKYLMLHVVKPVALSALSNPKIFQPAEKLQLCEELDLELSWAADAIMAYLDHFSTFDEGVPFRERLELKRSFDEKTWEIMMWCREKDLIRRKKHIISGKLDSETVKGWLQSMEGEDVTDERQSE
ncbi:hypothetical protein DL96DRAFT_1821542 [Flagelloscypha sp. PMI_526]|nr:hypothetical protein DL96DRAFT_1821542 [Flagelloscypha sp. PMI_526]